MTTINDTLRDLAAAIIDCDRLKNDCFETILNLKPILDFEHFKIVCLAADLCPLHETDLDTCEEDDLDCPFRSNPND